MSANAKSAKNAKIGGSMQGRGKGDDAWMLLWHAMGDGRWGKAQGSTRESSGLRGRMMGVVRDRIQWWRALGRCWEA